MPFRWCGCSSSSKLAHHHDDLRPQCGVLLGPSFSPCCVAAVCSSHKRALSRRPQSSKEVYTVYHHLVCGRRDHIWCRDTSVRARVCARATRPEAGACDSRRRRGARAHACRYIFR
eukprot:scaffold2479_cov146-Isochrysis_galbana.AAC.5